MDLSTAAAAGDKLTAILDAIAAKPDGVLETIAADHSVSLRAVLDCLKGTQRLPCLRALSMHCGPT